MSDDNGGFLIPWTDELRRELEILKTEGVLRLTLPFPLVLYCEAESQDE